MRKFAIILRQAQHANLRTSLRAGLAKQSHANGLRLPRRSCPVRLRQSGGLAPRNDVGLRQALGINPNRVLNPVRVRQAQHDIARWFAIVILFLQTACGSPKEQAPQGMTTSSDRQILLDVNKYLSEKEQDILASYVARQQLTMRLAPSGYYYQVVEQGRGAAIADGSAVRLYGRIFLIDGTPCYSYTEQQPFDLVVGAHSDIRVLNTALTGMREGSKVRFVFPSHMVYGLLGDGDKIPPRSPLVCEFVIAKVGN